MLFFPLLVIISMYMSVNENENAKMCFDIYIPYRILIGSFHRHNEVLVDGFLLFDNDLFYSTSIHSSSSYIDIQFY